MKIFFKRLSLFVLPVIVLLGVVEYSIRQIPNSYKLKSAYLNENSHVVETLILGSSHTFYGINPEFLNSRSFNMSNISQSPDIDLAILKSYINSLTQLETIIIRLSYDTLFEQLKNSSEDWRLKDYKLYTPVEFEYAIKHNSEVLAMGLNESLGVIKKQYLNNEPRLNCDSLGFGIDLKYKAKRDVTKSGSVVAKRHTAKSWNVLNSNVEAFRELISICKNRNINVLLITPPAFKSYYNNLDTDQLNKTIEVGKGLAQQYPNCSYYNFLERQDFTTSDFYDADHLNAEGAKKFSLLLNNILEQ